MRCTLPQNIEEDVDGCELALKIPPSNHTNNPPQQGSQRSQERSSISLFSLTHSNQSSPSVFSPYLSVWVHSTFVPSQLSRRSGRPLSFRLACVSAWKYRQLW